MIDDRATMRRGGRLKQRDDRQRGRRIAASLKEDRKERVKKAAEDIEGHLADGDAREAWRIAKAWYRTSEDRTPKPCFESLETQTVERETLYGRIPPPGDLIPINVDPYQIEDGPSTDIEIRAVVKGMKTGRAGGASKITGETLKQ